MRELPVSSGLPVGRYVRIEIEDNGTGIPESIRERIFEACFTTKPGGSGLGWLPSSRSCNSMAAVSRSSHWLAAGPTVSLMLPAAAHRPDPPVASLPPPVVKTTGRILVIDDEEMILSVVGIDAEFSRLRVRGGARWCRGLEQICSGESGW